MSKDTYLGWIRRIDMYSYEKLTPWQRGFLLSAEKQLKSGKKLTRKQQDQLENIYFR